MSKNVNTRLTEQQVQSATAQNLSKLTEAQNLAILKTALAFRFGCNWGFIFNKEEHAQDKIKVLRQEKQYISAFKARNGIILNIQEQFLIDAVHTVVPNALDFSFVDKSNTRRTKERESFERYINRAVTKGQGKLVTVQPNGVIHVEIAIYSLNDTNYVTAKGKEYSAFKLNVQETIIIAVQEAMKAGKKTYAAVDVGGEVKWMDINALLGQFGEAEVYSQIVRQMVLLESETGARVELSFV